MTRLASGSARPCARASPRADIEESPMSQLSDVIARGWEQRANLGPGRVDRELADAIEQCIEGLDDGTLRVAEKQGNDWVVNQWLKQAVLLSFRVNDNRIVEGGYTRFFDKVPPKYAKYDAEQFRRSGTRVVPDAVVRRGAYVASDVVLMPSFVNIGAYVDKGSMIDTWATVGSCAQIGKNVHLSGGTGIGGVLEPLQASPTIIEDDCFVGARSEVVEGVIVERGSVLGMGVYIGQSTRIYDRSTGEVLYGRVPAGSVVVSGNLPSKDGKYSLYCAVIVKKVDEKTRAKTSLNDLLRTAD
jgi:2,3,4,5-tetrahydropyridine-2,6-dicarboxylate N-succinyltransferase